MKIVDLSHMIHCEMPVFPGTEQPILEKAYTLENNGFRETKLTMYSHVGTHMDAPAHMVQDGQTLDEFNIDKFIGKAIIIDLTNMGRKSICIEDLKEYEKLIESVDFLILNTGWSKYWGTENYFKDFPALSIEAAEWLLNFNLKGIGIDAISIDNMDSRTFPIHNMLFQEGLVAIENLNNLEAVGNNLFIFSCMPLKYKEADGSPIRATAIIG